MPGNLGKSSIFWCACVRKDSQKVSCDNIFNLGPSTLTRQCQYLVPVAPRPESSRSPVPILLVYGVPARRQGMNNRGEGTAAVVAPRRIRAGEKVVRDAATHNQGKVQLGEGAAPVFAPRAIRSGERVVRDAATHTQGKGLLGEGAAPVFAPRVIRSEAGGAHVSAPVTLNT